MRTMGRPPPNGCCTCAFLSGLLLCSAQLVLLQTQHGEELALTHLPLGLLNHVNDTVIFNCNLSMVNHTSASINWHKPFINWNAAYNDSQTVKIADSEINGTFGRHRTLWDSATSTATLTITNLNVNDSGEYHCELINFSSKQIIKKSNRIRLNVTGTIRTISTATPEGTEDKRTNNFSMETGIILAVTVVSLFLLFALILFMFTWRKKVSQKPQSENTRLEKEPPDAPVYTLDYGVLEFQNDKNAERPVKAHPSDNVEYATIVFPPSLSPTRHWH